MRNAMICLSVMLAVFLGWPLAFGEGSGPQVGREVARAPISAAGESQPSLISAGISTPPSDVVRKPESCYSRFRRENRTCAQGTASASCRLKTADDWDICEATGFWPS